MNSIEQKRKLSIIIVDDNTDNLHVLANILRNEGFKVATVKDGHKALKFIRHKIPDLILLDVMMPGMDGYEVCKRLKKNSDTREIPIIFITALSNTEDKIKGFEHGCVDYITKPFRKEEVLARINVHLILQQTNKELEVTNQKLKIVNSTKDKLFSIVAHDLRGPISSIAGMLEMVTVNPEFLDKANRLDILNEMKISAQNAYHLLENLLSWAKSQQGSIRCRPEYSCLNVMLKNIIHLFSFIAGQKNIFLRSNIPGKIMVYADTDMIMTVLRNLISNALKFTRDSGEVLISAKAFETFVEITVKDNGVGIGQDRLRNMFQMDQHFSTYGTRNEKGCGLGLLICKEFIENNGGILRIESQVEQGSRFIFTLPIKPGECSCP